MGRANKVVLAYSGGVDTSVCIPYLKQEWGVEDVITFAADLGQGDELEPIRQKALDAGASKAFAVADHQIAHIYVQDPTILSTGSELVAGLDGVDRPSSPKAGSARARASDPPFLP